MNTILVLGRGHIGTLIAECLHQNHYTVISADHTNTSTPSAYPKIKFDINTEKNPIPIDSTCVRIPTLRCHSQSLFLELHQDLPIEEIEALIDNAHPWVKVVPNTQKDSIHQLSPIICANSLTIKVGRVRKTNKSPNHIQLFSTGDQLLWGAAEPLRRTLKIIIKHIQKNQ